MAVVITWGILVDSQDAGAFSYDIKAEGLYMQHRFYVVAPVERQLDADDVMLIYRQANIRWSGLAYYLEDYYGYNYGYGYTYGTDLRGANPSETLEVLEF